jgi:hypothetical protein
MGFPYKVTVRESVREVVAVEDSVKSKLDLVPILNERGMENVSRLILGEHGFSDDGDTGTMSRSRGGVDVTVDPRSGDIEARASDSSEVTVDPTQRGDDGQSGGGGCTCRPRNEEAIREALRDQAKRKAAGIKDGLQRQVTERLLGSLADISCEMEQVASQITARALKRRASEIGQIKSISHGEKGSMTIVVEVPS